MPRPNSHHPEPAIPAMGRAWREGRYPDPEQLSEDVWVVAMPTETDFVPYTLTYVLRDARARFHVIDPGWDSEGNRALLARFLEGIGGRIEHVTSVLISHFHPDHCGLAEFLRSESAAELTLSRREQEAIDGPQLGGDPLEEWGVPRSRRVELESLARNEYVLAPLHADRLVQDADLVGGHGIELRVLSTPGHTAGHISFAIEERRMVFTGDHLLPHIHPGLGLAPGMGSHSETLSDYMVGLDRIARLQDYLVCPGHEYVFRGPAERCASTAAHHNRRTEEVRQVLRARPKATVWEIAMQITWTAGWDAMRTYRLRSALRQVAMHASHVRREGDGDPAYVGPRDLLR